MTGTSCSSLGKWSWPQEIKNYYILPQWDVCVCHEWQIWLKLWRERNNRCNGRVKLTGFQGGVPCSTQHSVHTWWRSDAWCAWHVHCCGPGWRRGAAATPPVPPVSAPGSEGERWRKVLRQGGIGNQDKRLINPETTSNVCISSFLWQQIIKYFFLFLSKIRSVQVKVRHTDE